MLSRDERDAVIAEARSWIRTPYHDHGMLKGVGADCALMPLAVYRAVLPRLPQIPIPEYVMQWHLHRGDEVYLDYVRKLGGIEIPSPGPGDFVLFKQGRLYAHGAIVVAWPRIIHAVNPGGVLLADVSQEPKLSRAPRFCFSL